jgi:AAA+ ATPase superfamily predicted ATPase
VLYDEPVRLFLDDMRDSVQPFTILSLIASGCNRLSEIAARLNKPATNFSNPLDKLISLGYVEREIPFGENLKNSKKSLYKIADPFLRFYFHYVVPNRSAIESENIKKIIFGIQNNFNEYVSQQWERCCREYVKKNKIKDIAFENVSRWWGNVRKDDAVEFDVVALSEDKKTLLVGECKWSDSEINEENLLKAVLEKAQKLPFAQDKEIITVLFLKQSKHKTENVFLPEDIL